MKGVISDKKIDPKPLPQGREWEGERRERKLGPTCWRINSNE